jgi:hypothetical protein
VGRLIVAFMFVVLIAVFGVIIWGWKTYASQRPPVDDWAPLEAAFGRKFLSRTARSRRRWARDPAGRERLIEATKHDVGYVLRIDGTQVDFVEPAALDAAMDDLERKIRNGSPSS